MYAQVTAGVIATAAGAIVVDTLPFPAESRQIATFAARISPGGARYVVLTHYHADHAYGAYLFPKADMVAHRGSRILLEEIAAPALEEAKAEAPELEEVLIRLPDITFEDGDMGLQLGGKVVRLIHAPGHTADMVMVYVEDPRVLFAADNLMPVPSIVDGDPDVLRISLHKINELQVENLVQGHGEVILRGEVPDVVQASLDYLDVIEAKVANIIESGKGREALRRITIEQCGLSRIPLGGLVQQIHQSNLIALYDQMTS
jgi:glyoxylase-like metal-dependent hydrolase (beta-lactamase superfamily II)